jgi:hypothetical protein
MLGTCKEFLADILNSHDVPVLNTMENAGAGLPSKVSRSAIAIATFHVQATIPKHVEEILSSVCTKILLSPTTTLQLSPTTLLKDVGPTRAAVAGHLCIDKMLLALRH